MKFSGSPTCETVQVLWLNFLSVVLGPEALFAGVIPHGCAATNSRDKKKIIAKCFVKWAAWVALQALRFRVHYNLVFVVFFVQAGQRSTPGSVTFRLSNRN